MNMTDTQNKFLQITFVLEHWIFPIVFILLACGIFLGLTELTFSPGTHDFIYFSRWFKGFLLLLFYISVAYFLYMTRNSTKVYPDQIQEIVLPVVATFWFLTYSIVDWIPETMNPMLIPNPVIVWVLPAGICLNLIGLGISMTGVLQLKRSFGIIVKVNDIITAGLYRYVRHPIYFGYLLTTTGFMLMNPRCFHLLAYAISIALQIWRARIEENKLAQYSEEYRDYMKQVPFLIPHLCKRGL